VAEVSIYTQFVRFGETRQRFQPDTGRTVMRRVPLGIAISIAFHAVAVAWVATRSAPAVLPTPHPRITIVEILPPSTPEPVAVAFLDEPTTREIEQRPDRGPDVAGVDEQVTLVTLDRRDHQVAKLSRDADNQSQPNQSGWGIDARASENKMTDGRDQRGQQRLWRTRE
jgi:hypothetical protein